MLAQIRRVAVAAELGSRRLGGFGALRNDVRPRPQLLLLARLEVAVTELLHIAHGFLTAA